MTVENLLLGPARHVRCNRRSGCARRAHAELDNHQNQRAIAVQRPWARQPPTASDPSRRRSRADNSAARVLSIWRPGLRPTVQLVHQARLQRWRLGLHDQGAPEAVAEGNCPNCTQNGTQYLFRVTLRYRRRSEPYGHGRTARLLSVIGLLSATTRPKSSFSDP